MESLRDVFDLMKPGVWMTYVMPITPFRLPQITRNTSPFLGRMYTTVTCLHNEYSQAPSSLLKS